MIAITRRILAASLLVVALLFCGSPVVQAQKESLPTTAASAPDTTTATNDKVAIAEKLRVQIRKLNDPSYRTRQLAVWHLQQHPTLALPLLREEGERADLNTGAEIVALLSQQAMMPDSTINIPAHEALKALAGTNHSVTAVSHLASSVLAGIADRQELLAQQSLLDLKVEMGLLQVSVGGAIQNSNMAPPSNIVLAGSNFVGTEKDARMFRFMRSYDTAVLEGEKITEGLVREIVAMPGLKRFVLRGPMITKDMLNALNDLPTLQHLELAYVNIDDSAIDTIVDLPLTDSLRIFGSSLSAEGMARIRKDLMGLDIYLARGGFLGVMTGGNDLVVSKVVPNSGAQLGGVKMYDLITQINGKRIKTFNQLREELALFADDEKVTLTVQRPVVSDLQNKLIVETLQLEITLLKMPLR